MDDDSLKLSNQVCFPIYATSRMITKAYKPHLDALGLTYPQYLVMLVLWEEDCLTVNQICKKLYLNTNTLTPLLKRMEKQGLISRTRSTVDERSVTIALTQKGIDLKERAREVPEALTQSLETDQLTLEDLKGMKAVLSHLIDALGD